MPLVSIVTFSKNDSSQRYPHRKKAMNEISRYRSFQILLSISSISLQFISAVSDGLSITENGKQSAHPSSRRNTGAKVVIILVGVVAVALFSFFLFKLWQKKKREEQYARLLKLFEEDDELEVELGLRD